MCVMMLMIMKLKQGPPHLAALTGADPVVIAGGLVLAHEAGLVDTGRGQGGRGTWDQLLRTGALGLDGCRDTTEEDD